MTKRAFTLVELLVVVGIMAAMATMSIGSYFAVVRGMADRGALATATSVISLAQERANMDLTPTVVYFYNELIQNKDVSVGDELVVAGAAVAVRRAGRVTRVTGDLLCDEFADFNITYGLAEDANSLGGDTFRLYKFDPSRMRYSTVYSQAVEDAVDNEKYLVETPVDRGFLKESGKKEDAAQMIVHALKIKGGNAGWKPGEAYAYEFAKIRLPDNYIFGNASDLPSLAYPLKEVTPAIMCYPGALATSLKSVEISARRPSGWKTIGNTKKEMKDI